MVSYYSSLVLAYSTAFYRLYILFTSVPAPVEITVFVPITMTHNAQGYHKLVLPASQTSPVLSQFFPTDWCVFLLRRAQAWKKALAVYFTPTEHPQ
ncbi:hypothetical protein XENTR_v10018164 [Xenopus tropicalis]|nr:hypothetical protein XENTR_v10018164 [Xenopus tropicalis]